MNRFKDAYFQNIDASGLGLFRMLFGLVLCLQGLEFLRLDFVTKDIVQPILHFPFQGFEFLPILSESALTLMVAGLAIAGLFVAAGLFYRFALGYYFLVFTYLWLLDKGYFNNHYYLLSILCGIMLLLDADRWKPWKKKRNGENVGREWIPAWQVLALKVMLLIVFSWAGLNKLQSGWLVNHQPIAHIMDVKSQVTGGEWNGDLLVGFLIYGGALFDLSIIPLLWWKKTRFYAMFALIFFNVFNFWLFNDIGEIGIFPWLVIGTLPLFFEPDVGRKIWKRWQSRGGKSGKKSAKKRKKEAEAAAVAPEAAKMDWRVYLLGVFLFFQMLYPARHLLIPGHVDWTGEGQRFAWRMKIFYKDFDMHFYTVTEGGNGQQYETTLTKMLTTKQYTALGYYPDLIPTTARFIQAQAVQSGLPNPIVRVDFQSGLNGGPMQYLLDPKADATQLNVGFFGGVDWVLPYKGE